ncbi:MAG: hypothetical protein FWE67_10285 [Planctomycetaceae bacterium]|nr:hypothetical protein [Planctomycetaceae bacterium]
MSPPSSTRPFCTIPEIAPFRNDELSTPEEFERLNRRLTRSPSHRSLEEKPKQKKVGGKKGVVTQRKKSHRRRKVDPTTATLHYSSDEVEFMNALNDYKRSSGRMFPTCCEILEVLKNLGYEKTVTAAAE